MRFNVKELDLDKLEKACILEANSIFGGDNRTYEEVLRMVSIGKPPERYLIEKGKFTDDTTKYHDVCSPTGLSVEVKVRNPKNVSATLNNLSELRSNPRRYLKSDWVFIFQMFGSFPDNEYELIGTYKWNGDIYVSTPFNWKAEYDHWKELNEDAKYLNSL